MTSRRTFLKSAAAAMALTARPSWAEENTSPPNIIMVFIDDMGWADWSCFGNKQASTPHTDRLAKEGIAFEQFYVNSPICSPSRVAISTGHYPQRWNITSYLASRENNAKRGIANWLDPKAPMLARSLKEAGYATGHFGKWHMGGQRDVTDAFPITDYGFDESLTNFEGLGPKLLPTVMQPDWESPRKIWDDATILGDPVTWMPRSEITGGFVSAAIDFMDRAQAQGKPFYVNVWPDDVHTPLNPSVDRWSKDKGERYRAVLEQMDHQLSTLFDYVRNDPKLVENTLILMCSDNGHEPGAGQSGPLKGCKTNLYEGGIRSPLIAWGPGLMTKEAGGSRNTESVFSAIDLVPSLLRLGGAEVPSDAQLDGEDLLDTLLGRSTASRSAPIFWSRPPDRKSFYDFKDLPDLAVRDGRWKLLCDYDGARPELYDLEQDPSESANLANTHPKETNRLRTLATDWYKQVTP